MVSSTAWLFLSSSRLVFSRKLLTVRYFVIKRTRQEGVLFWEGILRGAGRRTGQSFKNIYPFRWKGAKVRFPVLLMLASLNWANLKKNKSAFVRNYGNSSELLGSSVLPLPWAWLPCGMACMADLCDTESFLFSLVGAQNQDRCILVGGTETWIWLLHFYFQLPHGPHLPSFLLLC